ncbi:hypothetical protein [Chitinophaga sp. Cy-1792]|uniref:hypothetical protein n=1 Tax=Chitinophaga sp. Cy-1792 TaxID=2608339 RepID=UPI001421E1F9|nr:hypothetical protein [Chitinophaga sp. Cy-1792]NIG56245.1 hypothetical protein [Chitinophaga sp. Cy-1792]
MKNFLIATVTLFILGVLPACNIGSPGAVSIRYQKMAVFSSLEGALLKNGNNIQDTAFTNQGCCYYVYRILEIENNQPGATDFTFFVHQLKDTQAEKFVLINTNNLTDSSNIPYLPHPLQSDTIAYHKFLFKPEFLISAGQQLTLKHHNDFIVFIKSDKPDLTNTATLAYGPELLKSGKPRQINLISTDEEDARVGVKLPMDLSAGTASNSALDDLLKK